MFVFSCFFWCFEIKATKLEKENKKVYFRETIFHIMFLLLILFILVMFFINGISIFFNYENFILTKAMAFWKIDLNNVSENILLAKIKTTYISSFFGSIFLFFFGIVPIISSMIFFKKEIKKTGKISFDSFIPLLFIGIILFTFIISTNVDCNMFNPLYSALELLKS